jgi:type I restriction enzyme S subunit
VTAVELKATLTRSTADDESLLSTGKVVRLKTKAISGLKKLRDVCELVNGRAYGKSELLAEGKYRVLRVGNFFTNNHWYYSDLELDDKKYCAQGDLLYAWSASFGPRIWTEEKVIYHYHIWKVIPNLNVIDQRYLFHFFDWDTESIKEDQGAGTTMMHVSKGSMEDRDIQIPPLPEQQRIVTILDDAFEGIAVAKANVEKNLQNARSIFQTQLNDSFNVPDGSTVDQFHLMDVLIEQPRNGWSPPASNHSDAGIPVLTLSAVTGFKFRTEKIKYTSARTNSEGHYWVNNGDLLISRSNTSELVGHVAIAENIAEPTIYPDLIMRMNADSTKAINIFLYFQLRSTPLRIIISNKAHGANPTMKKVNKGDVQTLPLWIPSVPEQEKIAAKLTALEQHTAQLGLIFQRKIAALDDLKKSLLHRAFNGEL